MPAAHLHCRHISLVDVRPLFTVYFDGNEVLVKNPCNLCIFEALMLHYVAPMTRAIADAQEDRLVLALGLLERLLIPGLPVHRVVLVLAQIGARGARKAIAAHAIRIRHNNFLTILRVQSSVEPMTAEPFV